MGGVRGSNFILSKHLSHYNIPEHSPTFFFSEFPHLQALVCALLKKEGEVQGGEGTWGWAADRHQPGPTPRGPGQLEPRGSSVVTAGESTRSPCRGDSDRLNPNQMCTERAGLITKCCEMPQGR